MPIRPTLGALPSGFRSGSLGDLRIFVKRRRELSDISQAIQDAMFSGDRFQLPFEN